MITSHLHGLKRDPARSSPSGLLPWDTAGIQNALVRRSIELASMASWKASSDTWNEIDPQTLRRDLQEGRTLALSCRRGIVALSLIGMLSTALVSLFQMGLLRHLPDPPIRRFHSDKVNSSYRAHQYGIPDGTISLAIHALNVVLAAIGGREHARRSPWLPLAAAAKAAIQAGITARYLFHQMPVVERTWCGYSIVDALAHVGTFALSLPEAYDAYRKQFRFWRKTIQCTTLPI